jgi:hypothetical protein
VRLVRWRGREPGPNVQTLAVEDQSMLLRICRVFTRGLSLGVLPALLTLAVAACDDDPNAPAGPTGEYEATSWTATSGGRTTDVLEAGGSFTITLTSQGTTTGHLFIPASVSGEGDLDSDLTGTWTQSGSTIQFDHAADTFVRDMPFTIQGSTLIGDRTFGDLRVRATLTRMS